MAPGMHCILLAGAPDAEALQWDESDLLIKPTNPFTRTLADKALRGVSVRDTAQATPSLPTAKWRSIELVGGSGLSTSRTHDIASKTQFLSFHDTDANPEDERSEFLEHSIAALDVLDSSQILCCDAVAGESLNADLTVDPTTSFATTSATVSSLDTTDACVHAASPSKISRSDVSAAVAGPISNLKQIPAADYISGVRPQTITVNLLVGVVTISPARTVHLKRRNAEMDIVELVVGDETRAGFTTSFWLAPLEGQSRPADNLRQALRSLRIGNVVLLQNVALTCFRNCVYGQSLSKSFARNSTSVTLLDEDSSTVPPGILLTKLLRVRDWTSNFVGIEQKALPRKHSDMRPSERLDALPPDTQD